MYSGDRRKESLETLLRGGVIVLAAFVCTLFIFLLFQQFMQNAQGRLRPLMTAAGVSERRASNTAVAQSQGYSPLSPSMPRVTAGYVPQRTMVPSYNPGLPPPGNAYKPADIFSTNEERDQAVHAVESLRTTIQIVRRYDASFWQTIPRADVGGATTDANNPATGTPLGVGQETENGTPTRLYGATSSGAATERQKVITRISNEAEALHTELSIVAHPELFPERIRNLAKTAGREARIYLSTVQQSLANPDDRSELQRLAREHLTRSEAAIRELEQSAGGIPQQGGSGGLAN